MGASPTVDPNKILGISGGTTPTGTTSGPPSPNPTAVAQNNPSAWYYEPEYMVASPMETPGAFGMSGQDVTPTQVSPNTNIYTGDADVTANPLSDNQLKAAIADRLHIKIDRHFDGNVAKHLPGEMREDLPNNQGEAPSVNWTAVAQHFGIATTSSPKQPQYQQAGQIAASLHQMNPQDLTGLQQKLYNGGFYDNAVYTDKSVSETPSHITQWTQSAFGNLLSTVDAYNKQNPNSPMTWQQFLDTSQNNPNLQGPIGAAKTASASVPYATSAQLFTPLQAATARLLGRGVTQQELDAFTKEYDSAQAASKGQPGTLGPGSGTGPSASGFVTQEGVPYLPGVATPSAAAVPFVQSGPDQTEFLGHQMANAGALMLNAILGNRSEEAGIPGYNPNITSASSAV